MRTSLKFKVAAVSTLFALALPVRVHCQSAVSERSFHVIDARTDYERPKTPAVREALERSLADLTGAQNQLRTLVAEGKMKGYWGPQGAWMASSKSIVGSNCTIYSAIFQSESGPIVGFDRRVFVGDNHGPELRDLRYEIGYYPDGKVKYLMRWGPGSLDFYPDGTLKKFSAELDERTSCGASWDAGGKLTSEGTSTHLPRNEKSLPEFENMLRHGDIGEKATASSAMAEIGAASIPYALSVLGNGDEMSREQAVFALGMLREKAGAAVPDLVRLLKEDPSASVRRKIALALGDIGGPAKIAVPALEEASSNDTANVADTARFALERIRRSSAK